MRQFLKRLLVVVILTVVTQSSFVSAAGIRVIGPSGRIQDAPEYKLPVNQQPSKFYGPTKGDETLWSIASKLRPSRQVTVQQTLLAIFELNPGAFENQNIHSLIPGSTIRIPSLAQVRSVTTQQAVAVMKTHQIRLDREAESQRIAKSKPAPKPKAILTQKTSEQKIAEVKSKPEVVGTETTPVEEAGKNTANSLQSKLAEMATNTKDQENLLALEEKNHHLMLMLSKVQSEVEHLKSNLDDETRIRTEVEKLLSEEKRKSEEAAKLAPTSLDMLLSKWWFILGLGLIPGALIAYLIIMFIRKRGEKEEEITETVKETEEPEAINIGEIPSEGVDDLMLDDDLFAADDKDEDDVNADDVFAELEDSDLSISLEDGEDAEDPFAAVGDDGDFIGVDIDDTLSGESANGISVNADDKAVGLEEMEKALDEVANDLDDDFDLSDEPKESAEDSIISQDDIESLLSGVEDLDNLEEASESSESAEDVTGKEAGEFSNLGVGDASIASDSELDDLFDNIESQANLDEIEDNALSEEDYNLDSDDDYEESLLSDDDTSLLDELVDAEDDNAEQTDWDKELDELSSQFDLSSDDDDFDEDLLNSAATLDELLEESDISEAISDGEIEDNETLNNVSDPELSNDPIDDGTEFLDELIEIEKNAQESEPDATVDDDSEDFNSDDFLDDLLDSVPENDPLLDDMDLDGSTLEDDFDFNPEIEGHDTEETPVADDVEVQEDVQANEFGVPQDDDWDIGDEDDSVTSGVVENEFQPDVVEDVLSEEPEPVTEAEVSEPEMVSQPLDPESVVEAEEPVVLADEELPEFTEEDILAGEEVSEPELSTPEDDETLLDEEVALDEALTAEPEPTETAPQPLDPESVVEAEEPVVLADEELPEFTEEGSLAGEEASEPELSTPEDDEALLDEEVALDEALTAEPEPIETAPQPLEPESDVEAEEPVALADEELPEFSEEDALDSYDSETEYAPEIIEPISEQNERFELDDDELPDFDEYELLEKTTENAAGTNDRLKEVSRAVFDEKALDELLSEEEASDHYTISSSMDDDFIDSGGMNIETMLEGLDGEDWNGFKLSPEQQNDIASDIPDDEQDIWREDIQTAEPELENENWAVQDNIVDDDPKEKNYMSIDELMAQVDADGGEFEEQDLKLDVGLNEFPDVIGNISDIDVDSNAEASGKLDLAKIYMEMNDEQGAIKLLEEAIVDGDDGIRRQAKELIDRINGSDE